jgi:serine/threonine protein kinase
MNLDVLLRNVKTVGDYELLELLGRGGMAAVFKGRKTGSTELVAVKVLPAQKTGNPLRMKRFEQEFRAASRLDHPNIVKVLDFGTAKNVPYLVMELVEGPSLGARLLQGRVKEREAVDIHLQVAHGLRHAHQHGLIHRDVKPDNILLAPGGVAKLTDLGLVKVLDEDTDLTRTNSGLGTPNFMAPEQFCNAKHADPRCDVYSLGATLYMTVTGEIPFKASTPLNVLNKKMRGELPPAGALVPGLSDRVERTIHRALSNDPNERQANCVEFIADLTGKSEHRTVRIRRLEVPAEHLKRYAGRERRRQVRRHSGQEGRCVPLAAAREDEWTAQLLDVSTRGVGLLVNRRFEIGAVLVVRLPPRDRDGPHCLVVRVVRNQSRPGRKWLLGCLLPQPLSEEDVQSLL